MAKKSKQAVMEFWDRISQQLTQDRRSLRLAIVTGLIVLVGMYLVLGWGFVSGYGDYWQNPNYDANTHVSGWLYYKADTWHLPLFDSQRMDYPQGASIIYTDSIPLAAVPAKLLNFMMPRSWNYMGVFVLFCYVANCLAVIWLLKQLGIRNVLGAMFAAVLTCFTSLYNLQFESLFAYFFLILSLGFYFKLRRTYDHKTMGLFSSTVILSLLVHTYLFALSLAIYMLTWLMLVIRRQVKWRWTLGWLAAFAVSLGLIVLIGGYTNYKPYGFQERLYGTTTAYALDLTAPFNKSYSENEIGTYIGLGVWLLAIAGVVALWRRPELIKRHAVLLVFAVLLVLFAISNTVFWHDRQLLHIHLPAAFLSLAEAFRAGKRFISLPYFLAAVGGFTLITRRWARAGVAIVLAALVLQVADVSYFVKDIHTSAAKGQMAVINPDFWKTAIATPAYQYVNVFPSYSCLFDYPKAPMSQQWNASLQLYHITAVEHKISDQSRVARRSKDCVEEARTGHKDPISASLNVYLADDNHHLLITPSQKCLAREHVFAYGIYCTDV